MEFGTEENVQPHLLKIDKNNEAKTMENIDNHLKLVREMRVVPPAYVVRQYIKVAHISLEYLAYLSPHSQWKVKPEADSGLP